MASEAQKRANKNYQKKHYDQLNVSLPKGTREQLKAIANEAGKNLTRYILEAIEEKSGLKLTLDGEFKTKKSD